MHGFIAFSLRNVFFEMVDRARSRIIDSSVDMLQRTIAISYLDVASGVIIRVFEVLLVCFD